MLTVLVHQAPDFGGVGTHASSTCWAVPHERSVVVCKSEFGGSFKQGDPEISEPNSRRVKVMLLAFEDFVCLVQEFQFAPVARPYGSAGKQDASLIQNSLKHHARGSAMNLKLVGYFVHVALCSPTTKEHFFIRAK